MLCDLSVSTQQDSVLVGSLMVLGMVIVINMYRWTVTLREEHSLWGFEN
jgi:hypothetical protein